MYCRTQPGGARRLADHVAVTLANTARWRQHPGVHTWLSQCRLNSVTAMMRGVQADDSAKFARIKESGAKASAAAANLSRLLAAV